MLLTRWTVDYGDGPHPAIVPHAWGQEVSVEWEGQAVYRTDVDVPRGGATLRFRGVSFAAEVFANGELIARHRGIWDAFDVPLPSGKTDLEVRVTKNGGPTYPVGSVASGGLPYLFQTFGGIFREVELLEEANPLHLPPPAKREPLPYVRGVVHRGWYPDLGHPNPDEATVQREIREIKALGFNLIKFAGWLPPHRYLELLEAEGLWGWVELPLGGARFDPQYTKAIFDEAERIVRQYRHHASIGMWSLGDAHLTATPRGERAALVDTIRALTGAWVGDGTANRTGEIGDFDELGTIGDPTEAAHELRLLRPTLEDSRHAFLGSLAASHAHRDLARLGDELPFWASALRELNARGDRLGSNLSDRLESSRFALEPTRSGHRPLMASSRSMGAFVRKTLVETTRAARWIDGYALEELRDTPVSSAGLFDDWDVARVAPEEAAAWNGPACLFPLVIDRRSRQSPLDSLNHFAGTVRLRIGIHTQPGLTGRLAWRIIDENGRTAARGAGTKQSVEGAREVGTVEWRDAVPGGYRLEAEFGATQNAWDLWVVEESEWQSFAGWRLDDPESDLLDVDLPGGDRSVAFRRPTETKGGVLFLDASDEGTERRPFWEGALQFQNDGFWSSVPFRGQWARLLPISAQATLRPDWLKANFGEYETLLERIDTSSYGFEGDAPILVRAGDWIVTTLRPCDGGRLDPSGSVLLACLMQSL